MIICICRRLNEKAVHEAVEAGAQTPAAVQAHHGCRFNCGKCREAIDNVIRTRAAPCDLAPVIVAAE